MPPKRQSRSQQKGGGSTDYTGLWYAPSADPAQLTRYGLQYVDRSPMFNPLQTKTIFPTPTSGVIPVGIFYDSIAPLEIPTSIGPPVAQYAQLGGAKNGRSSTKAKTGAKKTSPWIAHVKNFATTRGLNYAQALRHPDISKGYTKVAAKSKPKPKA